MKSINFNEGIVKYAINGNKDRVIEIVPSDSNIIVRFEKAVQEIQEAQKKYSDLKEEDNKINVLEELDNIVKAQIDYIFGYPVSKVVFGNIGAISPIGDKAYYERFLEAILPVIKEAIFDGIETLEKREAE